MHCIQPSGYGRTDREEKKFKDISKGESNGVEVRLSLWHFIK